MSVLLNSPRETGPLLTVFAEEPGLIMPIFSSENLDSRPRIQREARDLSTYSLSSKKFIAILGSAIFIVLSLIFLIIIIAKKIF